MKTPRFTDSQIMAILKQAQVDMPASELCHKHGITWPAPISDARKY